MTKDDWMDQFYKENPVININRNKQCNIENINVIQNIIIGGNVCDACDYNVYSEMYLKESQIACNTVERSILLNTKLEQFGYLTKRENVVPIIRYQGLYSGLSTNWERSSTNDTACLEIKERDLMIELVQMGCDVRILVTLDIQKALFCGFSKEDILKRISDLCEICDKLKSYKNFKIAVDSGVLCEPRLILGKVLVTENYNYHGIEQGEYKGNYKNAIWKSNRIEINVLAEDFDKRFQECTFYNQRLMVVNGIKSYSELIYHYGLQRLKEAAI